jgi:hypothetical protein
MLLTALALTAALCPQRPAAVDRAAADAGSNAEAREPAAPCDAERWRECVAAADRGLAWLAARQGRSGGWLGIVGHKMNDDYVELDVGMPVELQRSTGHGHPGVSALCGMAFLAAGNLPDRGQYQTTVQQAIDYIVSHALENGMLTDAGERMYSHAFATLFLAEVYGMAGGPPVRQALERAVNLIVDSQNQYGGWRYNPFDREIDLSVTVCQVQALRAARNIGIKVPDDTITRAIDYVMRSRVDGRQRTGGRGFRSSRSTGGQFYYKIYGRGAYDKPNEYAINAAALTALTSAGIYDRELSEPTLDFLEREYADTAARPGHFYFWYGNYYACQAFFQTGGPRFRTYYDRLTRDLLREQRSDGSWCNEVGPGDEFSTAVGCLLLQLPRQYLPIFQR